MTVSHWQADGTQPTRDVDVLVIGAGLAGCAAAYFAAQAGRDVVITEARDLALGASGRNAGFIITGLDSYYHLSVEKYGEAVTREMWDISKQTIAYWKEFARQCDVPIDPCGSMLLAESEEEARDLERAARALDAAGYDHQFYDYDPLNRGYFAALEQSSDAATQPVKLVQGVFGLSGAELIANNEVYAIRQDRPGVVTVESRLYHFQARHVMICTNAYSLTLHDFFADKIIPTRAQCLVTEPLPQGPILNTMGYSNYGYMYYRDTFDGRLLVGGARHLHKAAEQGTLEDKANKDVHNALDAYLQQYFPDVTVPVARRWSGTMGFTPDGLPVVGRLPGCPNVGFAVGFNGHGLALSAATAERAVDMLLNSVSVGAVDVSRLL